MNTPRRNNMEGSLDEMFFERGLDYLRNIEDIRTGLTNIVRSAAAAVGSDCASLYLLQESTRTLEPYILCNVPDSYLRGCTSVPLGTQCCGRAALYKVAWAVADMWSDPLFVDCAAAARESGMRSGFSVPVMIEHDECIGTLAVQFKHPYEAMHSDIERLGMFARLISMAVLTEMTKRGLSPHEWISRQLDSTPRAA